MEASEIISVFDFISFLMAIVSFVLAVVAIVLSFVFYSKTTQASEKIQNSADNIANDVNRLDQMFNKLYSDTFSMVKDSFSGMQKQLLDPNISKANQDLEKEIEEKASKKVSELNIQIENQLDQLFKKLDESTDKGTLQELKQMISKTQTIEDEIRAKTVKGVIYKELLTLSKLGHSEVELNSFVNKFSIKTGLPADFIKEEFKKMVNECELHTETSWDNETYILLNKMRKV